jgi:3-oxoacyl-[acyl-carrier protein] reductase
MSRRVLVTGSSRGIGRAIALELSRDGFELALHFHQNQAAADEVLSRVESAGTRARLLRFDCSHREECRQAIEDDLREHGPYFGVVCNAGVTADASFPAMEGDEWDRVLRTNLDGFYNVLQPVIMPMVQARQGGRIVTMSSVAGLAGNRGQVNYAASKAGIIGATKSLAQELAKRAITVNCVAPGIIETDMTSELPIEEVKAQIPMRRFGKPEEVSGVVSFLLSDRASYITGQVISVNGGML